MKLWLCTANCDDFEPCVLHVAKTEDEAKRKMKEGLDDNLIWYASIHVEEVSNVDGYGVLVKYR